LNLQVHVYLCYCASWCNFYNRMRLIDFDQNMNMNKNSCNTTLSQTKDFSLKLFILCSKLMNNLIIK
jgi:hypothetical protein